MRALPGLTALLMVLSCSSTARATPPDHLTEASFGFRATVESEQFEARFGDYSVVPRLGPGLRPTGFAVEIAMAAIDSGNIDRDAEMQLSEWFDTATHPTARFHAQEVGHTLQDGYVARGAVNIKGVARSIEVPFSWQSATGRLRMMGEIVLDRRWFGVGPADDSSVAAEVTVFFDFAWGTDGH